MHEDDPLGRRQRLKRTHAAVAEAVVREVAARVPASMDRATLDRVGTAALDRAAESYDVDSGIPFASYVRTVVRRALVDLLRSQDWTTPPTTTRTPTVDPLRLGFVADAVAQLPERLAFVVRGYFLEHRSMAELAAQLGVTEARVSQLRAEGLVLLRDSVSAAEAPALRSLSA